ncbi:uncharacterized protein si:ch211-217g15.3 [Triplophysa rosa]|uniref:Uncharacterized protein n=1 Tax=Triplophysa rosa TaxID=992332 RepID=A0A9W7WNM3_TRIRA|nr:uncharacterized protein si:ch211-217g15.3 [Triplophysa rosa]KAI7805475.1 hypothetical protein IRJ41_008749 [Triplophysa rosa]
MIRFAVLICLPVVLFSTSAKPYRPREIVLGKAAQDTLKSEDLNGKMMLGMKEVEPPQDMDIADFDIDPNMLIWKAVKDEIHQKNNRPEEDKDALYHPFDLKLPADSKHPEPFIQPQGNKQVQTYDKPEEDRDDLYHGIFNVNGDALKEDAQVSGDKGRLYLSPEEDKDDLYHADVRGQQPDQQVPLMDMFPIQPKRVHTEPEIDLDGLYHQ